VVRLRHGVLILVKSSAAQRFDAPTVYAVNKKETVVASRAPAEREWR
jgi:hypothetical protein